MQLIEMVTTVLFTAAVGITTNRDWWFRTRGRGPVVGYEAVLAAKSEPCAGLGAIA